MSENKKDITKMRRIPKMVQLVEIIHIPGEKSCDELTEFLNKELIRMQSGKMSAKITDVDASTAMTYGYVTVRYETCKIVDNPLYEGDAATE